MGKVEFGKALRRIRGDRGLSQEAFADLCGLHRTYISQLERGTKIPSLSTVEQIARALAMRPSKLIAEGEGRRQ